MVWLAVVNVMQRHASIARVQATVGIARTMNNFNKSLPWDVKKAGSVATIAGTGWNFVLVAIT